jgi:hypothetical protein
MDMCVYLSLFAEYQEKLSNPSGFVVTAAAKARVRVLCSERLLWFRTGLLSNYPNRRQRLLRRGALHRERAREGVTVDYDAPAGGIVVASLVFSDIR